MRSLFFTLKPITAYATGAEKLNTKLSIRSFFAVLVFFMISAPQIIAQPYDVPYVPTPNDVVDKMLDVANVGHGDYVIDLGSGDGRIVIAASKRGAYGHGVDINPERISEAVANARRDGVENKVLFVEGNIFNTDFSRANVITMYLLNSVNLKLRPFLLENLKPGSRVVSHDFDMNEWKPDQQFTVDGSRVYFWVIPAKVEGKWSWRAGNNQFIMSVDQEFQQIQPKIKSGNTNLNIENAFLSGKRISFTATNPSNGDTYLYSGEVEGENIIGLVQVHNRNRKSVESWIATLE